MSIKICRCKKQTEGFNFGIIYEIVQITDDFATVLDKEGCEVTTTIEEFYENFDYDGEPLVVIR